MKKTVCLLLAFLLGIVGWMAQADVQKYQLQFFDVFDTFSQITIYSGSKEQARQMTETAHEILLECHRLFDIYHDYPGINNLKTVNDMAGIRPVKVDERLFRLLQFGKEMYYRTDGRLNIAMGGVLRIWHEYREKGLDAPAAARLPSMAELEEARQYADIEQLILDEINGTVYLANPNTSLDVGAIGKGFAVELAAQAMENAGDGMMLMDIGGNIRTIGCKADGTPWRVGIQNPDLSSSQQYLTVTELSGLSLVSSGDYQRSYVVDGKEYHHIIDPETLMPGSYYHQVTVVCRDSGMADAFSTALFLMPLEEGIQFLQSIDGAEALWVLPGGKMIRSEGFSQLTGEETGNKSTND